MARAVLSLVALTLPLAGCARAPSPLSPSFHGSIGTANHGVLTFGAEVQRDAPGLRWLRDNDRHWGLPRFTASIERAADRVAHERPGASLAVGDLSPPTGGGPLPPHLSHRSGIDADLLFYVTTLEGVPVPSPGFVHVGADGLARDERGDRWLRFDVDREWRLVRAMVEDPEARLQWIFVSDVVQAMLVEWALAHGDSLETIGHAQQIMHQPHPGGIHDDHIHVRTACSAAERVAGCEAYGPRRAWLDDALPRVEQPDRELVAALLATSSDGRPR